MAAEGRTAGTAIDRALRRCLVAALAAASIISAAPAQAPSGATTVTIVSGDVERSYRLHVPAGYSGDPIPLVLDFHDSGGAPDQHAATSGFDAIADREGFAVAYPAGVFTNTASGRGWNANVEEGVDDVQFARDLIGDVGARLSLDGSRIYVTGFSGGARMSSRLACELADILAAAAPVAGLQYPDDCVPAGPVSIIAFHGSADRVEQSAEKWRRALDCPGDAMEGGFRAEPGIVVRAYPPCARGGGLVLYISERDGNTRPAGASERIWAFFDAHPR